MNAAVWVSALRFQGLVLKGLFATILQVTSEFLRWCSPPSVDIFQD